MRKLLLLAAMLAMMVLTASPALAHDDFDDFDDFDDAYDELLDAYGEFDQESESGDANQTYIVTNTGDNSNQCVGLQGVTNTGNAQNQLGLLGYGGFGDEFELEDASATVDVSPLNTTTCDQAVNQDAYAYSY